MNRADDLILALAVLEPFRETSLYEDYREAGRFTDEQYEEMLATLRERLANAGPPTLTLTPGPSTPIPSARTLREIEMEHVLRVLEKHAGNKPAAAAELGISLKTLYNKINQLQQS